jgi:hypothetical protein
MLASIPAHTPEWTIQQPGDPGTTLVALLGYLGDTILYRANLLPERQRLAFLKLLGMPLQPAAPAKGIVSVFQDPSATAARTLASGAAVSGPPNFETLSELDVLPVTAQVYIKLPLTPEEQSANLGLLTGMQSLYSLANVPSGYHTTPVFAGNLADAKGIDIFNGTIDQCLWIALIAAKPANRAAILANLGGQNGQRILSLGFAPALAVSDPFAEVPPQTAVPVTWQIAGNSQPGQPLVYYPLSVASDTTAGLTTAGVVQLLLPQGADIGAPPNDVRSDSQAGVGPKPPRVDDPNFDSMLVTWIRVNVKSALTLNWAGTNAVQIDQRTTYYNLIAGVSDGTPNQQFSLAQSQIDATTFQLDVDMPGLGPQPWSQVDDLGVVQGAQRVYALDPEAGMVSLGNQVQGLIPPLNSRVRARLMRAGGGSAGNLPPSSLTKITGQDIYGATVTGLNLQQPFATTGGADAETLDQAERRIPATLRHQNRAVTVTDYRDLVQQMPGGAVARVEVLPLFKPQTRDTNVPGVVSVMVIPSKSNLQPPCPRADRILLDNVYAYLDPKRPVAAEMYVIGTEYIGLALSVAVEVQSGYGLLQVKQQVELSLGVYLWPTPPGGPTGAGWPLGRTVRSLELEVIISRVAGVSEVNGVQLFQPQSGGGYQQVVSDSSGNAELTLYSWQLPELLQVSVTAGVDGSGVSPAALTPDLQTDNTVAVPLVPTVC